MRVFSDVRWSAGPRSKGGQYLTSTFVPSIGTQNPITGRMPFTSFSIEKTPCESPPAPVQASPARSTKHHSLERMVQSERAVLFIFRHESSGFSLSVTRYFSWDAQGECSFQRAVHDKKRTGCPALQGSHALRVQLPTAPTTPVRRARPASVVSHRTKHQKPAPSLQSKCGQRAAGHPRHMHTSSCKGPAL